MSAIALAVRLDRAPTAAEGASVAMATLAHRGPDGADLRVFGAGSVAIGHQHFHTVPEEVGERQPLVDGDLAVSFDGRIDNRAELRAALGADAPSDRDASDATLVLAAFRRWDLACVERLVGPFALAIYDEATNRLLLARDAVGSRTLAYHHGPGVFVAASEPAAVAAHPDVGDALDEASVACLLALRTPAPARTLFRAVTVLAPGNALCLDGDGARIWQFWRPPTRRLRGLADADYADRFRDLLTQSVVRRMRAVGPIAVQMSGGLDSTSVAALAAEAAAPSGGPVRTFSYVFDTLPECDERAYIATMVERHSIVSTLLPGDDAHPLADLAASPYDPNAPSPPYAGLVDRVQSAAEGAGVRALLSGYGGDQIYGGAEEWLADLLSEGRFREGLAEVAAHVRHSGVRKVAASRSVRRVAARVVGRRPRYRPSSPEWLTERGSGLAEEAMGGAVSVGPEPWPGVLDAASWFGLPATYRPWRARIELRCPFWDRDLVTFMAEAPAHQRYNRGAAKHVLRNAMRGRLPEKIRSRTAPTSLTPFFGRGMIEHAGTVRRLLDAPDAGWRPYVRSESVADAALGSVATPLQDLLVWTCVSFEVWLRRRSLARPVCAG